MKAFIIDRYGSGARVPAMSRRLPFSCLLTATNGSNVRQKAAQSEGQKSRDSTGGDA
jgi:hypothetical protein